MPDDSFPNAEQPPRPKRTRVRGKRERKSVITGKYLQELEESRMLLADAETEINRLKEQVVAAATAEINGHVAREKLEVECAQRGIERRQAQEEARKAAGERDALQKAIYAMNLSAKLQKATQEAQAQVLEDELESLQGRAPQVAITSTRSGVADRLAGVLRIDPEFYQSLPSDMQQALSGYQYQFESRKNEQAKANGKGARA